MLQMRRGVLQRENAMLQMWDAMLQMRRRAIRQTEDDILQMADAILQTRRGVRQRENAIRQKRGAVLQTRRGRRKRRRGSSRDFSEHGALQQLVRRGDELRSASRPSFEGPWKPHSTSAKGQPALLAVSASTRVSPTSSRRSDGDAETGGEDVEPGRVGLAGGQAVAAEDLAEAAGEAQAVQDLARERFALVAQHGQRVAAGQRREHLLDPGIGPGGVQADLLVVGEVAVQRPVDPLRRRLGAEERARPARGRPPPPFSPPARAPAAAGRARPRVRLTAVVMSRRESMSVPSRSKTRRRPGRECLAALKPRRTRPATRRGSRPASWPRSSRSCTARRPASP